MSTLATTNLTTSVTIDDVIAAAKNQQTIIDAALIREAYNFAAEAHAGQYRKTGEAYIDHPLHVAFTIAQLGLGTTAIIAALLHDVREDTAPSFYEQITPRFGEAVNFLVQGVTKLSKIKKLRENRGSIEDLRTIFLAMTRDIRVIIVKLADRLHNLQTLGGLPSPSQKRIAQQTLDVYAPIADRLGMGEMKGQLEDLAFMNALPDKAQWVSSLVKEAYTDRVKQCEQLKKVVARELKANKIPVIDIHGRAKRLYSLYLKLQRYNNDINQIYDLVALRIIVPTQEDCYKALGVIHARWKPLVGKIKDYVATPKANGYQSLHTTVIVGEEKDGVGRFLEIQIRTPEMHERAEHGIAAAWAYAESKRDDFAAVAATIADKHDIDWVEQLARWQRDVDTPEEFFQMLRSDFFRNRIFCLTPAGEIINLPDGATPIDFAYAVHTELGHHAISAKINRQNKPLDYALTNGDLVEIIPSTKKQGPQREWLDFVKTNAARKAIKQWFAKLDRQTSKKIGTDLLMRAVKDLTSREDINPTGLQLKNYLTQHHYQNLDALFIGIGRGERNPRQVVKRIYADELFEPTRSGQPGYLNVKFQSDTTAIPQRARCCRPIEGDTIGALVKNNRAIVHRDNCPIFLNSSPDQRVNATWIINTNRTYRLWIQVKLKTYVGMMRDLASLCAARGIPIHDVRVDNKKRSGLSFVSLLIETANLDQLGKLLQHMRLLPHVLDAKRGRY